MSRKKLVNLVASVRQRLLNISKETGSDANLIWTRYAIERLLYRLASSDKAGNFVLKGAMLFMVWTGQQYRLTYDLDLLGFGENSEERIASIFRHFCELDVEPDGLFFDPKTIQVEPIREGQDYKGQRVTLHAFLGKARIPLQVDIGFGDVLTPEAVEISYPTLLDFPAPHIRACSRETVVAEKLQAMVLLGIANSRMKDFYDLYVLARDFSFEGSLLSNAIEATFKRRKTPIPDSTPLALSNEFAMDKAKITQWNAFLRKNSMQDSEPDLPNIIASLGKFLLPLLPAFSDAPSRSKIERMTWENGGPWQ